LILNNKGNYDSLTVSANGNFTFPKTASTYVISAKLYLLGKICTFSNLSGIALAAINNIGISCTNKSYTVGEAASGLLNTGIVSSFVSGDDGALKATITKMYIDNGDGTVTDNVTGLIYQKCSSGQGAIDCSTGNAITYTWNNANSYCNSLGLAGKSWRLPTVNELANILDYSKSTSPTIDEKQFPSTKSGNYWTSSSLALSTDLAWRVSFNIGSIYYENKTTLGPYVRCISGTKTANTFSDNGDGTVADLSTGLKWQKCSAGNTISNCSSSNSNTYIWENAVLYCNSLNLAGRTWRLPNVNELRSLVNYTISTQPTINNIFSFNPSNAYWSSSTVIQDTSNAWFVFFGSGYVAYNTKSSNFFYVRCVSGP
jgi:hypothetical protein